MATSDCASAQLELMPWKVDRSALHTGIICILLQQIQATVVINPTYNHLIYSWQQVLTSPTPFLPVISHSIPKALAVMIDK
jgi:hypothetical protein